MTRLQVRNLTFARGTRKIVDKMSFDVVAGEFVGLIGPNGTGKSTLLKLLAKLLPADTGQVIVNGQHLVMLSDLQVARLITYMPQSTALDYRFTVEQVVLMGRHPHRKRWQWNQKEDYQIAYDAMTRTGIFSMKDRYINTLSGGERQLAFLARAITQQSEVILLDEPTSDLDIYHQVQICQIVNELTQEGKTVIAAIHDISLAARYCDRVMFVKDGHIAAFDTPSVAVTPENLSNVFHTYTYVYKDPHISKLQIVPFDIEKG